MRLKSCGLEQKRILLYDPAYKCAKCETWIKALHRKKTVLMEFPLYTVCKVCGWRKPERSEKPCKPPDLKMKPKSASSGFEPIILCHTPQLLWCYQKSQSRNSYTSAVTNMFSNVKKADKIVY